MILCPEDQLILSCARTRIDSQAADSAASILRAGVNSEYLTQTALRHGVAPLVYRALQTLRSATRTDCSPDALRAFCQRNALVSIRFTRELIRILDLLGTQAIGAIPLKGPVLAASVYGNVALRQAGDLDILVSEDDIERAADLLVCYGYRQQESWVDRIWPSTGTTLQASLEYNRVFLRRPIDPVIELHWGFAEGYYNLRLDHRALKARLQQFRLSNSLLSVLGPADLLCMLCVHGARHRWARLIWICDVAELSAVYSDGDWRDVLALAGTLRISRILFLGLRLARDVLGADLPPTVQARMDSDPVVYRLAAHVRKQLFRLDQRPPNIFERSFTPAGDSVESMWFQLLTRECLRDRGHHFVCCVQRALTPSAHDRALMRLPACLQGLLYVIPFLRLFGKLAAYGYRAGVKR